MKIIKPGSTIGILGGGQLGRMMVLAGRNMGYRFILCEPNTKSALCDDRYEGRILINELASRPHKKKTHPQVSFKKDKTRLTGGCVS
nr:hypothetical protein [Ectobacillus panaciterrae]